MKKLFMAMFLAMLPLCMMAQSVSESHSVSESSGTSENVSNVKVVRTMPIFYIEATQAAPVYTSGSARYMSDLSLGCFVLKDLLSVRLSYGLIDQTGIVKNQKDWIGTHIGSVGFDVHDFIFEGRLNPYFGMDLGAGYGPFAAPDLVTESVGFYGAVRAGLNFHFSSDVYIGFQMKYSGFAKKPGSDMFNAGFTIGFRF